MTFTFGDQVRAVTERVPEYTERVGRVVAIGHDDGAGVSYAVSFDDGRTVSLWESELLAHRP